ncbi:MAG: alpha/beta hydrolase [Bacteriovoracaceae bacterium]|jgi:epoxide hydrolase 4|nr:alpha/beta hydrolase [Bacteriovoracaceae bacterium]
MELKRTNHLSYLANCFNKDRESLFFLHGFPDNYYVWKELTPYLIENYNIVCACAPHCSNDSFLDEQVKIKNFRLNNLTSSYLEIININNLENAGLTLIAHDMGGPYAHKLLEYLNDSVKLICLNTLSGQALVKRKSNPEQLLRSSYMTLFQLPFITKKTLFKFWYFLRENAQILGRSDKNLIPSEYDSHILNGLNFYKALLLDTPTFLKKKKWENRVLFVWSLQDPFLVRPTEKELGGYYKEISFKTISAGHWPMLDEPKELAQIIDDFLQRDL